MLNGQLIQEAREGLGISQARLAQDLGVREVTVWRWENKPTKSLDWHQARALAQHLGVDEESLFVTQDELDATPAPVHLDEGPQKTAALATSGKSGAAVSQ